jgi:hypothetical protein
MVDEETGTLAKRELRMRQLRALLRLTATGSACGRSGGVGFVA